MAIYEFTISTCTLRIPTIAYKLQGQLTESNIGFIESYLEKSDEILQKMYDLVNKVQDDNTFQRQSFNSFVIQAFQNNTCLLIQQNLNPEKNQQFNLEQCNSIANGIFKQGLVQVVKLNIDLFNQRQPEIIQSDFLSLFQILFQQQQYLSEPDQFYLRVYFEYVIQIIEQKMAIITFDHYDYMIKINYIIFFLQMLAFIILIYIYFFKFFEFSISQIRQTKQLLNLLDIKTIEENQYILTYLKIQR